MNHAEQHRQMRRKREPEPVLVHFEGDVNANEIQYPHHRPRRRMHEHKFLEWNYPPASFNTGGVSYNSNIFHPKHRPRRRSDEHDNHSRSNFGISTQEEMNRELGLTNFDPTGMGTIASAASAAVSAVSNAVTAGVQAKSNRKIAEADDAAQVAEAKENRTAELSHTTQDLIKAQQEKTKSRQKTQMIFVVAGILIVAVLAYVITKE